MFFFSKKEIFIVKQTTRIANLNSLIDLKRIQYC